jgi:predicted nucleic acid-binding protein
MTTYLLDVNLLLALTDPMHIHHESAYRWFAGKGQKAWATCPLTENGFVRIASYPALLAIFRHIPASRLGQKGIRLIR